MTLRGRIVQDLRDPAAYVRVPAGRYLLDEDNKRAYRLKGDILVARYPVTNSQYSLFVRHGIAGIQGWVA